MVKGAGQSRNPRRRPRPDKPAEGARLERSVRPIAPWCRDDFERFMLEYQSYIKTSLSLYRSIARKNPHPAILRRFEQLKASVKAVDHILWMGGRTRDT